MRSFSLPDLPEATSEFARALDYFDRLEAPYIGAAEETLRVLKGDLPLNLVYPSVVAQYRRRFV